MRDPMAPGGDDAVAQGCSCPRLDNGHGDVGLAEDRGGWVVFVDCPLHGEKALNDREGVRALEFPNYWAGQ